MDYAENNWNKTGLEDMQKTGLDYAENKLSEVNNWRNKTDYAENKLTIVVIRSIMQKTEVCGSNIAAEHGERHLLCGGLLAGVQFSGQNMHCERKSGGGWYHSGLGRFRVVADASSTL
ncbi:hypothetical protein E2542_SST22134 [Spatholobus suberectus]|nr:hypothetical protein E2542_SST22134 [Spatholobus suberectus]